VGSVFFFFFSSLFFGIETLAKLTEKKEAKLVKFTLEKPKNDYKKFNFFGQKILLREKNNTGGHFLGRRFLKIANSLAFHNMPCHNPRKTKEVIHQLKSEHPLLPRASKVCFQLVNPTSPGK
jgi:hypothetical protein